jgi:hypothetical protein
VRVIDIFNSLLFMVYRGVSLADESYDDWLGYELRTQKIHFHFYALYTGSLRLL